MQISQKSHGLLDAATVAAFASAPRMLGFSKVPKQLALALSGVHGVVSGLTEAPLGLSRMLPLRLHGWVEKLVGPVLIAAPWIFGFAHDKAARNFFVSMGLVIGGASLLSDYEDGPRP